MHNFTWQKVNILGVEFIRGVSDKKKTSFLIYINAPRLTREIHEIMQTNKYHAECLHDSLDLKYLTWQKCKKKAQKIKNHISLWYKHGWIGTNNSGTTSWYKHTHRDSRKQGFRTQSEMNACKHGRTYVINFKKHPSLQTHASTESSPASMVLIHTDREQDVLRQKMAKEWMDPPVSILLNHGSHACMLVFVYSLMHSLICDVCIW